MKSFRREICSDPSNHLHRKLLVSNSKLQDLRKAMLCVCYLPMILSIRWPKRGQRSPREMALSGWQKSHIRCQASTDAPWDSCGGLASKRISGKLDLCSYFVFRLSIVIPKAKFSKWVMRWKEKTYGGCPRRSEGGYHHPMNKSLVSG